MRRVFSILIVLLPFATNLPAQGEPVDIGSRLELFVDHTLIESLQGSRLVMHTPRPEDVVLRFDKPWEGRYCGYMTVLRDGEKYRMYYRGLPIAGADGSNNEVTCYAESPDGLRWCKPDLGLFEVRGTKKNNVVLANAAPFSHNFFVFVDAKPGVSPSERFKALAGTSKTGLVGFVSADGIRWRKIREKPLITKGAFDSHNIAFWSVSENQYVCYFRTFRGGYRAVDRCTSKDFLNFSEPVPMTYGRPWKEHLYTNQTHPYFRAPHIYVSIAARFMPGRKILSDEQAKALGIEGGYGNDCSDTVLMTSRGGNRYDRTFMESFMRPGLGRENWSSRSNYSAYGVVPTGEGEMSIYIQRKYGQPTQHLLRYSLRTDGFVSVQAPFAGGEIVTKPLRFKGKRLTVNFSTSAAGSIRTEIQDANGKPIPGYALSDAVELIGDEIERTALWKGGPDVGKLAGKTIRLRFVMKDADLYALRFE